jgi:membrane protein
MWWLWPRPRSGPLARALGWLKRFADDFARARTFGVAAEMSFWLFLSLVPLAAVAGMAAARLALSHQWLGASAFASVPPEVRDLIAGQVEAVAGWHGATVAPLAAVTFLWLGSSGVQSVFDGLQLQTGCARPWWKKRLLALGTCIGLAMGVAVIALLATGFDWVEELAGRHLPPSIVSAVRAPVGFALRQLGGGAIAVAMTAGLYRIASGWGGPEEHPAPVLPGAVLAVVLEALLGWGYGWYLSHLGNSGAYEAGLTVVAVTLTTLWLFCVALLAGAELNTVLGEYRRDRATREPPRESPQRAPSPPTAAPSAPGRA